MTTPIIGEGDKIITTVLLNGERIHVRVHAHANGQNVFDAIIRHIGLNEVIYFGLMIIKDGEQQFLNLEDKLNKLAKYAPHLWKDDGSCNSSLVFTLFFRVKYYVENICLLQEQATRHQYYLQLRKDVLENSVRLHDDTSMVLASYALQAELGDYDKNVHGFDYFVPQHYLPAKTIAKLTIPYIKNALPAMHQSHRGLTEGQAEIEFLKEAQKLSEYGVLFHRVYKKEYNKKVPYNLGICVRGLVVYEETGPVRNPVCKHPWSKIKKMSFKRSKFIVEADSTSPHYSKMTLYTSNYKRSRYLLKMSSSFFNFQMMMASRLAMLPDYLPPEEVMHHPPGSQSHQSMIPSVRIDPAQNMQDVVNGEDLSHQIQNRTSATNTPHHPNIKETPKPKPKPKPEVKQYTLDLLKRDGSFGFSIVGGIELGGIFVKDVTPGGPAAISGLINAGDRIVQINKDSFENVTRREAIATLRNAPDKSRFIMETFGQNLVIEADASIVTPLAMSAQSLAIMQPQVPVPQSDRESEFIRVDLPKKDNSFGIGFTGGPELGGVYIKSLLPGGSAEADGRIAIGDRLVEIDQTNVEGLTRKQIQELLKQCQGVAAIIIERYKQIPAAGGLMYIDREKVLKSSQNFTSITLHKKNDSLGFSITGGLDLGGIFVKYLNPNGPASMDGRLEVGDRVVAVNDISLETSTRQKALEIIRNATSPVNLIIEKCISPNPMDGGLPPEQAGVPQMTRSDSIKSLPTSNRRPRGAGLNPQSRNLTYSMQHLPNANANIAHDVSYKDQRPLPQRPPSLVSAAQQKKSVQDVFVVDLNKHNGSYGISLTGGHEVGGIYIKAVMPGGAADVDGRIFKGDKVIEINARRMDGLSRQEAIDWLKSSGVMATFVLERFTQIQPQMNHTSNQPASQFSSFDGGGPELRGIFIKNLLPGGPAANDGRIVKGDRLVEINAVSLDGLNRHQANDLLKQCGPTVNLLLEKIQNLTDIPSLDVDLYSLELKKSESGFGFSITGGPELGGVYIKGILPGGAADSSHKIMRGDRLVEVNGVSLDGLSKQQAVDVIRKSPPVSNLLLERHGCYDNMILPESEYFTVELHKKYNGYGLSLTGGPEIDGVYVKQVQRDSSAYQDGRIKKGDRLITINGRNVESCTKQKCTEMLKQSTDIAVIHFERCVVGDDLPPLDTVLTVVELTKGANGFGISLTGGPETGGIFVKALMPGGAAESDGRIFVGDRVVEMNSVSLEGYTRQQATDLLKTSTSAATFVLERYKQTTKSIASTRKLHMIHNPLSNDSSRPTSPSFKEQHNSFPFSLYNGAAPSVPPRHLNNGIPSRESAFKRLEQQQLKMAQQNNNNNNTIPPERAPTAQNANQTTYYQSGHHNIQGSPVSSRLPSFMQRQQSADQNNTPQSNPSQNNFKPNESTSQRPTYDQNNMEIGSLSLVDGPMRKFVDNATIEDSPQRFLQQFSRSVVSSQSNNNTTPSRIAPLGPVSSVIFGNNRDNRNVHEILDPGEKTLEETLIAMSETQRLEYLRINHPELLNEYRNRSILSSTNNGNIQTGNSNLTREELTNQRAMFNPRETVVCLSNGKPLTQTFNQQTPVDITTRPVIDPNAKFHQDQRHSVSTNGQLGSSNQMSGISTPGQNIERLSGLVKVLPDSFPSDIKNRNGNSLDSTDQPKHQKSGGLQWVSLNDSGESNWSVNSTNSKLLKKQEATSATTPPHERTRRQTSPVKQTSVSSSGRTTQSSSTGIPVPLASKFHPVTTEPKVKKTAFAGGDYVFEVNLSKGSLGLGMNLAGGGSEETPVTIKKIAPGTAADECGQLRVGDVILEINGKPVSHLPAKDVIGMLRSCPSDVLLLVKRKTYETHYHVTSGTSSSYIGL